MLSRTLVAPIENPKSRVANPAEPLPLSLLNDLLYCPRRAALKVVEGWREANEHTVLGDLVHEHADLSGYEVVKGVTLLRALPIWSERLGLSGKCDIVEVNSGCDSTFAFDMRNLKFLRPVEYKKGKRRSFENDDAQLCAQALCLEEMFGVSVERGAVFHAESKRRREVEFTAELRSLVERSIAELHELITSKSIPPARYIDGRCENCSLFQICLPRVTHADAARATAGASRRLFQT